jgi:hypothetical protein
MDRDFSPSMKSMPWSTIVERYRFRRGDRLAGLYGEALKAIEGLADAIGSGPMASVLFGWTSMFDLCIQQTDAFPGSGPYLKVSPLASGMIEFRYLDTAIEARQWHREVPPEAVAGRFQAFLDQLGWLA